MVTILDEENQGYALGAAAYLTKPVDRASPQEGACQLPPR